MGVVTSRYDIPNRFVTSPVKTRKDFYFFLPICERQKKYKQIHETLEQPDMSRKTKLIMIYRISHVQYTTCSYGNHR